MPENTIGALKAHLAGHSFLNRHDFGPGGALLRVAGIGYHGPSAEDAWQRILRFFEAQLRA